MTGQNVSGIAVFWLAEKYGKLRETWQTVKSACVSVQLFLGLTLAEFKFQGCPKVAKVINYNFIYAFINKSETFFQSFSSSQIKFDVVLILVLSMD